MNLHQLTFMARRSAAAALLHGMIWRNYVVGKFDKRRRFYAEFLTDRFIRDTFFPDFAYVG